MQVCNLEFSHLIYNALYSASSSSLIHHADRPDILVYFAGVRFATNWRKKSRIIAALCVSLPCYFSNRHVFRLRRAFVAAIALLHASTSEHSKLVPGIRFFPHFI